MKIIKTEAVVLKEKLLLKNDAILTLFTKKLGKIRVVAKGIKKITSRRLFHTDTGNLIEVVLKNKRNSFYLQQTLLISSFSLIKNDFKKIRCLFFVLFILDRLLAENQEEKEVFVLTLNYISKLARGEIDFGELLSYCNRLFFYLGYGKEFVDLNSMRIFVGEIINEKIPSIE